MIVVEQAICAKETAFDGAKGTTLMFFNSRCDHDVCDLHDVLQLVDWIVDGSSEKLNGLNGSVVMIKNMEHYAYSNVNITHRAFGRFGHKRDSA